MSKPFKLTDEQVEEFKEVFTVFDKSNSGSIATGELGALMAQLGQKTSDFEMKELVAEVDSKNSGKCTFQAFVDAMSKRMGNIMTEKEVLEAFKVLDKKNTGVIAVAEFRNIMTSIGLQLTQEQVDEMLADVKGDKLDYKAWVRTLMTA